MVDATCRRRGCHHHTRLQFALGVLLFARPVISSPPATTLIKSNIVEIINVLIMLLEPFSLACVHKYALRFPIRFIWNHFYDVDYYWASVKRIHSMPLAPNVCWMLLSLLFAIEMANRRESSKAIGWEQSSMQVSTNHKFPSIFNAFKSEHRIWCERTNDSECIN